MRWPKKIISDDLDMLKNEWKLCGGEVFYSDKRKIIHVGFVNPEGDPLDNTFAWYWLGPSGVWWFSDKGLGADDWVLA